MLSGGSKSFKSWCLMDMGVSVAEGLTWWGLQCKRGKVLYLNFELIDAFFEERLLSICRARNVEPPQGFLYWNLRGYCYDLEVLAKVILARLAAFGPFDLIVVDPVYKALGDLDENKASDMTKLMNLIETITVQTGSSVAFGSHFSKGNQAGKEAKDRPSGSGVLIRDPDAIITMTRHQQEHCYVVNSELRYLPPQSEFVVRWNFPVMQPDESLDPRQLYVPGKQEDTGNATNGGPNAFSENDVLECLPVSGGQDTLWRKMVALRFGRTGPEFYAAKAALLSKGLVVKQGLKYFRTQLRFERPQ
jgi:RecA-family ATPase